MKTWREAFDATSLANGDAVTALDSWVRTMLAGHRGLADDPNASESIAPWSVQTLARSIGAFGDAGQWLWAVTAISLPQSGTVYVLTKRKAREVRGEKLSRDRARVGAA